MLTFLLMESLLLPIMCPRAGLNEDEKKLVREFLMQNAKPE